MTPAHDAIRKLFEVLGRKPILAEGFDNQAVWDNATDLLFPYINEQRPLPSQLLPLVSGLSQAMGLAVGAPTSAVKAAIERCFDTCPYGEPTLTYLATYMQGQLNGALEGAKKKKGPDLGGW